MFDSVNKAVLLGNLGKDPEVRTMSNSKEMVSFSIATSESWLDKSTGERMEKTEWHPVVVFNEPLVQLCKKFLKKGAKVYVEGSLKTRKWSDSSNNERYITEVVLGAYNGIIKIVSRSSQSNDHNNSNSSNSNVSGSHSDLGGDESDIDDDIPF